MKHNTVMRYVLVAAAALVVGLLAAGTPWRSLLPLVLLLGCPLMMMGMTRGMGGHGDHARGSSGHDHDHDHAERDEAGARRL